MCVCVHECVRRLLFVLALHLCSTAQLFRKPAHDHFLKYTSCGSSTLQAAMEMLRSLVPPLPNWQSLESLVARAATAPPLPNARTSSLGGRNRRSNPMMALLGPQLLRASADDLNDPATCHAKVWRELCYNVLLFLLPSFLFFPVFFF